MKKSIKFMLMLLLCTFFSMTVYAEEPVTNMTYEEWLKEQENIGDTAPLETTDLEPVRTDSEETETVQPISSGEQNEIRALSSIFEEKGTFDLDEDLTSKPSAEELTNSISSDADTLRTAPAAELIPIIVNEDSLVEGFITTDTMIAFFYNDTDADGDAIANRYVGGNAVDYILGEIDGGFVVQFTTPGNYQLLYQIEDSAGELSTVIGYSINVIQVPVSTDSQVFTGSFSSAEDSHTYNFSIDFTTMDSAAVCLVRKGYVGTDITVYDESGNQVLRKVTGTRTPKNWDFIDKPSADATICNYTIVAVPNSYENRASDYRIIIGNKNETELLMSGIENTVLLEQYYEEKTNIQNTNYTPNVGEYWYKYRRESTSVITILSHVPDLRFKVLEADTLYEAFNSAKYSDTHRTTFTGSAWTCAEKARLTTTVGKEYYLVVYSINPNPSRSLRTEDIATAVGYPPMLPGNITLDPGKAITTSSSSYTSTTLYVSGDHLPNTGSVESVYLQRGATQIDRWRILTPGSSSWKYNEYSQSSILNTGYIHDFDNNLKLKGTWNMAFKAIPSAGNYTFKPKYFIRYYYEYGDEDLS